MAHVTGTITLEIAPIGELFEVRMWIGKESVRISPFMHGVESAKSWARGYKRDMGEWVCAELIIVEKEIPPAPAGPQPDMFPVKR